jgi:PAS domain S-box-containing protein
MQHQPLSLTAEEQHLLQSQLLETVEQAMLAIDMSGRILFWNRFAETLYGWNAAEALGHNIVDILAAPLLVESLGANLEQLQLGKGWRGEFLLRRRDGTNFTAQVSATLIQSEPRTLIGFVSVARDSTEIQPLQQANRLLAELEVLLVDSMDTKTPLAALVQITVPQLADWCAVHLLQADGSIERVMLEPAEMRPKPARHLQAAYDWLQDYLSNDEANGLPEVLRSGESKLITEVSPELSAAAAAIKSYMIVPLIARTQTFGVITFVAAESGRRFDLNTLALAENLVSHIAIHLDEVRLRRESQRLKEELEQRVTEKTVELSAAIAQLKQTEATIKTLLRISNKLNATLEVDAILDDLAQEAIQIVNGESGFAGLRTAGGMNMRKYFRQGVVSSFEYTWPLGQGIPGWVLQYKVPYGTSDAAHDPVIKHELAINTDIRSIICTPILDSTGEVLAYFDIRDKQDGEGFTISDQEMLMALAPVASIAIQNALAYQQRLATVAELKETSRQLQALAANLESAREEERTRIARELHDQLGQALTAMKFDLAWLTNRLAQKDATLAQKAKTVTAQVDTMITIVRRIATELRPDMLEDLGLAASIEWQARDFEKRTGIVCAVSVPAEDLSLDRNQSVALFRIFQEALTNVARHASAQHIEVKLAATLEAVTLQVHDDGQGIPAREISSLHSLGLLGMQERAKQLGGAFDIQSAPGEGTIVTVSIPYKQSAGTPVPRNEDSAMM